MSKKNEEQLIQIRAQRQKELRRSAIENFSIKGFKNTKISDITTNANVSHGLFYHYFDSKEQLYEEVIRTIFTISLK